MCVCMCQNMTDPTVILSYQTKEKSVFPNNSKYIHLYREKKRKRKIIEFMLVNTWKTLENDLNIWDNALDYHQHHHCLVVHKKKNKCQNTCLRILFKRRDGCVTHDAHNELTKDDTTTKQTCRFSSLLLMDHVLFFFCLF